MASCLLLLPWAAASATPTTHNDGATGSSAGASTAIAPSDWLGEANYLRSLWSSPVPTLSDDATLSANDAQHVHYLDETKSCVSSENPSSPYYTAGGAYAATHSILYCGGAPGPRDDIDGWTRNPATGDRLLNPQLTAAGFAQSPAAQSPAGAHAAMDTTTDAASGAPITTAMTWPHGADVPFTTFAGDASVLTSCGSAYTSSSSLGAPLLVDLPGSAHTAAPTSTPTVTDATTGASVPVCVLRAPDVTAESAVLVPLHPLLRGDSYTGRYTAGGVTGSWSFGVALTPPSKPLEVDVLGAGNHEATIGWTFPLDDGGERVSGYDVEYRKAGTTAWSAPVAAFTHSTATSQTVTGLDNGSAYRFRVAALNSVGASGFTLSEGTVMPAPSAPDAPTHVAGTAGNASIRLSWTAPANDGGRPITSYLIQESAGGGGYHALPSTVTGTSTTVTGLSNGTGYRFRVAATSSLGTSTPSAASAVITPGPARPGRPQLVSALPEHGAATVSWLRPVSSGGGPLTGYVVQYSADGSSWTTTARTGTSTSQHVTGLTDGTSYRFRVAATNAAGAGPFASTVPAGSVTPGVTVPRGANVDAFLRHTTSRYGSGVAVECSAAEGKEPAPGVPTAVLTRPVGTHDPYQASAVKLSGNRGLTYFTVDPQHDSGVRCMTLGTDQHVSTIGPAYRVDVAPLVTLHLSKQKVRHGATLTLSGRVSPGAGGRVVVQKHTAHGWRALGSSTAVASDGTYRTTLTVSGHGHVDLRTHRAATRTNAAGNSSTVRLTIT